MLVLIKERVAVKTAAAARCIKVRSYKNYNKQFIMLLNWAYQDSEFS